LLGLLIALLIGFSVWNSYQLYILSQNENQEKYDFAEINKIKYGLFNLDIWKEKIFNILNKQVGSFELKQSDFNAVRKEVDKYLLNLHKEYFESGKLVESLMDENKDGKKSVGKILMGLFKGSIKKQVDQIDFKSKIPAISEQLIAELKKKSPEIKKAISKQISKLLAAEAGKELADQRDPLLKKYKTETIDELNIKLISNIQGYSKIKKKYLTYSLGGLGLALILLVLSFTAFTFKTKMLFLTVICTVFLAVGLALPMIDLDARLSSVDISLMGENIHFDEQVMYFQSKSILGVTDTLLKGRGFDLKLVGALILLFSIVFPFLKMLLTTFFLYMENTRNSSLVKTVIFYLGKWSMADVFVVAIFMSYIGLYGMINVQTGELVNEGVSGNLETINYSRLSEGIIYFTLYCIFSILMSSLIHRKYLNNNLDQDLK